jgi:hypothetical protein
MVRVQDQRDEPVVSSRQLHVDILEQQLGVDRRRPEFHDAV